MNNTENQKVNFWNVSESAKLCRPDQADWWFSLAKDRQRLLFNGIKVKFTDFNYDNACWAVHYYGEAGTVK